MLKIKTDSIKYNIHLNFKDCQRAVQNLYFLSEIPLTTLTQVRADNSHTSDQHELLRNFCTPQKSSRWWEESNPPLGYNKRRYWVYLLVTINTNNERLLKYINKI